MKIKTSSDYFPKVFFFAVTCVIMKMQDLALQGLTTALSMRFAHSAPLKHFEKMLLQASIFFLCYNNMVCYGKNVKFWQNAC
mgnify:CR=1 FL=1